MKLSRLEELAHPDDRGVQLVERTLSEFDTEGYQTHRPFQHTLLLRLAYWTRKEMVYKGGNIGYIAWVRLQLDVFVYSREGFVTFRSDIKEEKKERKTCGIKDTLRGYP